MLGNHSLFAGDTEGVVADEARQIAEAWNAITACFEPAETVWEALRPLELEVSESLYEKPPIWLAPDVRRLKRLCSSKWKDWTKRFPKPKTKGNQP